MTMRVCALYAMLAVNAQLAVAAFQVNGRLEWLQRVELRALENGWVEQVAVTTGQHVKKGALMLRMDQREAKARLTATTTETVRARLDKAAAQRELTRAEELFERGLIALEELKEAELGRATALAGEASAVAAEVAARVALEHTELRAPFDAIVVARNVWRGEIVYKTLQPKPLIVVAPDDKMLARALVTADVLRRYPPGQRVRIKVHGSLRQGRIYSRGVEAVRVERQGAVYELDAIFEPSPGELLRPSESIQIILP